MPSRRIREDHNDYRDIVKGNVDEKLKSFFIATFMNTYFLLSSEKESLFEIIQSVDRDGAITYILDTFFNIN